MFLDICRYKSNTYLEVPRPLEGGCVLPGDEWIIYISACLQIGTMTMRYYEDVVDALSHSRPCSPLMDP